MSPTRRLFIAPAAATLATAAGITLTSTTGITAAVPITLGAAAAVLWIVTIVRMENAETRRRIAEQAERAQQVTLDAIRGVSLRSAAAEDAAMLAAQMYDAPRVRHLN